MHPCTVKRQFATIVDKSFRKLRNKKACGDTGVIRHTGIRFHVCKTHTRLIELIVAKCFYVKSCAGAQENKKICIYIYRYMHKHGHTTTR